MRFLETSFAEAIRDGQIRAVNPKVAAFSFLGQVLWIYKWFRADGAIPASELAAEMDKVFFDGLIIPPADGERPAQEERVH